jgi:hypothetical protein
VFGLLGPLVVCTFRVPRSSFNKFYIDSLRPTPAHRGAKACPVPPSLAGEQGDAAKKGAGRVSGGSASYQHVGHGDASTLAAPVVFACGGVGAVQVTFKLL